MPPTRPYQERAAKWRRTNPADETRSGLQASQRTPPVLLGLSGLGQLTLEMIAAINTAVTQALRAAAATSHVQFVPDSQVPRGCSSVLPRIDSSTEVKPATEATGAVHGTVQRMLDHVIGTQDNASIKGKKHDASMLVDSNLLHALEQNAFSPTGEPMCVFGDPAYPLRVHLQAPFRHGILTPMMEEYNADMSSVRVTVEWLFSNIINDFKFLDFKKNFKLA